MKYGSEKYTQAIARDRTFRTGVRNDKRAARARKSHDLWLRIAGDKLERLQRTTQVRGSYQQRRKDQTCPTQ